MENVSKSSVTNAFYGGINQINQGNILNDNSSISQNINQLDTLMNQLKEEAQKISDPTLKEETLARVDLLDLLSKRPENTKLKRVKEFFEKNFDKMASAASIAMKVIDLILRSR